MMCDRNITGNKILVMFGAAFAVTTTVGILMQIRQLDIPVDDSRDCEICGPNIDKQIPMLVTFLKLLSAAPMPVTGLCSSCKVSFDGINTRRVGNYCVIWKGDGSRIVNTFELLVPKVELSCKCNPVLSGKISPPDALFKKFPCLNDLRSAASAMSTVNELSLEALDICQSMVVSPFNETTPIHVQPEARLRVSIDNFRFRTEARIDKELNVKNVIVRLSHMGPKNINVYCDIAPPYEKMCGCLETENIKKLIFYFIEAAFPCMLKDTVQVAGYKMIREYAFCFPDKKVTLYKNPTGNF